MSALIDIEKLLAVLLFMLIMGGVSAQNHTVSGTVTGEDGLAIPSASISYSYKGQDFGTVTDAKGKYRLEVPAKQTIKLTVSHIAYETKVVTIESSRTSIVKNIVLKDTAFTLDSVAVTAKMPTAKQKGDTTIYYAQAYKISHDASAYDLITQKITGISVNEGRIEVQGETVSDVMIDGKEYYKNDIAMALKNLPAYIINEVQVFDKTSDCAILKSVKSLEPYWALNIQTNKIEPAPQEPLSVFPTIVDTKNYTVWCKRCKGWEKFLAFRKIT